MTDHRQSADSQLDTPKISLIWKFLPFIIMAAIASTALISESSDFRSAYWQAQSSWFISLNQSMSVIPGTVWNNITLLGNAAVLIPLISVLTIRNRFIWASLITASIVSGIASRTLKSLADMPRPGAVLDVNNFNVIGDLVKGNTSLPSGHTITGFATMVAVICVLIPKPNNSKHYMAIGLGLIVATLIGLSRTAVGAHWPMDVIIGSAIGMTAGIFGAKLTIQKDWKGPTSKRASWFTAIFILLCSITVTVDSIINDKQEPIIWLSAIVGAFTASQFIIKALKQK